MVQVPSFHRRRGACRQCAVVSGVAATMLVLTLPLAWPLAGQRTHEAGSPDPRLVEAVRWYTGVAGTVDDDRARALLLVVAAGGDPLARMWIARCHSRGRMGFDEDAGRARELAGGVIDTVVRLAEEDVVEAAFLLGSAYDEGLGVPEDPARAAAWLHRAADRGHVLALHNLGNAYSAGRGVPASDPLAVHWWRKAAVAGDAIAQLRLATMLEEGRGVAADLEAARRWYREAAVRGNREARRALERLERQGAGELLHEPGPPGSPGSVGPRPPGHPAHGA